jgi:protein-L-isoaspartate(D-aspartate) O-methyltransferase
MSVDPAREQMVSQQVRTWDVLDERVLDLMQAVPREHFAPREWRAVALADTDIPIGCGQHMLAPKLVGRILQALDLRGDESVLEIGTGSGYLTACLAALAGAVRSLEIFGDLVETAAENLRDLAIGNATVSMADGAKLAETAAYDAVVLTASLPLYDPRFERALRVGGRLFVIVGERPIMEARRVVRVGEAAWATQSLFETVVDPLLNARRPETFRF